MLRLLKHELSNYFANMGQIHIYNHLTNQLVNQSTISGFAIYYLFFPAYPGRIYERHFILQ
jgi:hypothetical protein